MSSGGTTTASSLMRLLGERRRDARPGGISRFRARLPKPVRALGRGLIRLRYRRWRRSIDAAARTLGSTRVVVPARDFRGQFEFDVRSHVAQYILRGSFEMTFVPLFEAALGPGLDFIDVGANAGLYTVLGGKIVGPGGRVLAVEPAPSILPSLRANVARNGLENVTVFAGVATSRSGPCLLNSIVGNEEYSSLSPITHPSAPQGPRQQVEVAGETIDHLVASHHLRPALIKIDAEGAEGLVLRGAADVLATHRPVILSELDHLLLGAAGDTPESVRALLAATRYVLFDASTGQDLKQRTMGAFAGEVVAVPSEQAV
jgi:FkbM family methyltransferase